MSDCNRPTRIGYLPLYVDYYEGLCADFAREKAAIAEACAQRLQPFGELVWDGRLVRDAEQAVARGRALAQEKVDCVVVLPTIAVFSGIPAAALDEVSAPVLLWNAQQIQSVGSGYGMVEVVRNTSQIGVQAFANHLTRQGRWYGVVSASIDNPRTREGLDRFLRIIAAVKAVRAARLLEIGSPFPMMTDIMHDPAVTEQCLGARVVARYDAAALTETYQRVDPQRIDDHIGALTSCVTLDELTDDELRRSVHLAEAIDDMAMRHDADAGTVNCHGENCLHNERIGITACYALGVQNQRGRSFTCTGDLPTALAMLILKRLTGAAMYTEVQVMDEQRGAIVLANSGEGESGAQRDDAPTRVIGNTNFTGLHGRGAAFAYPLQPGTATVISLTPTPAGDQPFRLVVAEGELLDEPLEDVGALAGFFRFLGTDLHTGYARWLEAGPIHHAATAPGHHARELRDVCSLLDIEFIEIGDA